MKPTISAQSQTSDIDGFERDDLPETKSNAAGGPHALVFLAFALVRRWYWIALGLMVGVLGASHYLARTPLKYTAAASLLIKQQTATVMSRDQVDEIDLRSAEAMNTVVAHIQNQTVLERVAGLAAIRNLSGLMPPAVDLMPAWLRRFQPAGTPSDDGSRPTPPPAALARIIRGWLGVSIIRGTRLINISITHPVPAVAAAVADSIAREYVALIATTSTHNRSEAIELLEKLTEEARANLRATRSVLATYARAIEACKALDSQEIQVVTLQRGYLAKHPKLMAATAQLKYLQRQFISEFARASQGTEGRFSWESARQALPSAQTQPDDYLNAVRQQLLAHIGVLESEIQSSTSVFNALLVRIEESSLNQQAADFSTEISELSNPCGVPTGPDAKSILATGVLAGLAGGVFLAIVFTRMDNRFHTVAQVARETGAPVLGAIAEIKLHHLAISERHYRKRHPEIPPELGATGDNLLIFRPGASASTYAEMYRSLYASIARLGDGSQRKITLFSSALPGEGKTLTSANFAAVAASYGRKTLLIDLDLRKPAIHRIFGVPREPEQGGITECLANLAPFDQVLCHPPGHPNLSLIVSGKSAPNPGELLESGLLKSILAHACREFDVVVLDSAPFLAVSDTRIIAPLVHNFCVVAKADYAPKGAMHRVLEIMKGDGIPLSGIVFNSYRDCSYLKSQNYSYGYYRTTGYGSYSRHRYDSYGHA